MNVQIGTVVELKGPQALVLWEGNGRTRKVQARNPVGARPGDRVRLVAEAPDLLQSSAIRWGVPVVSAVFGIVLGEVVGGRLEGGPNPHLLAAILAVAFFAGSVLILRIGPRAFPHEVDLRIAEILSGGGN